MVFTHPHMMLALPFVGFVDFLCPQIIILDLEFRPISNIMEYIYLKSAPNHLETQHI